MTDKKSRGRPEQGSRTDDLYSAMQRRSNGAAAHLPTPEDEAPGDGAAPDTSEGMDKLR